MHLVQAILLALLQREKTGRGQQVAVSLFESMLAMQMQEAAMWLQRGRHFSWGSYPLTGAFATTDGAVVLVGAFKTNPLQDICKALDLPDLSAAARYATFKDQVANKAELQAMFRKRFAANTTEYWLARLDEQDLLCAPVLTLADALGHPQTQANGTVVEGENGALPLIGTPLTMDPSAFKVRRPPPELGADGGAILAEAGYSADRIAALKNAGVIS
jgi:formyl-CoA transferase